MKRNICHFALNFNFNFMLFHLPRMTGCSSSSYVAWNFNLMHQILWRRIQIHFHLTVDVTMSSFVIRARIFVFIRCAKSYVRSINKLSQLIHALCKYIYQRETISRSYTIHTHTNCAMKFKPNRHTLNLN